MSVIRNIDKQYDAKRTGRQITLLICLTYIVSPYSYVAVFRIMKRFHNHEISQYYERTPLITLTSKREAEYLHTGDIYIVIF